MAEKRSIDQVDNAIENADPKKIKLEPALSPWSTTIDGLTLYDESRSPREVLDENEIVTVQIKKLNKDVTCPICLSVIDKTFTVMDCLHRFCTSCIETALRVGKRECPTCRAEIPSRRNLRADPEYDSLIQAMYPNLKSIEEEEQQYLNNLSENYSAKSFLLQAKMKQEKLKQEAKKRPAAPKKARGKAAGAKGKAKGKGAGRGKSRGAIPKKTVIESSSSNDDSSESSTSESYTSDSDTSSDDSDSESEDEKKRKTQGQKEKGKKTLPRKAAAKAKAKAKAKGKGKGTPKAKGAQISKGKEKGKKNQKGTKKNKILVRSDPVLAFYESNEELDNNENPEFVQIILHSAEKKELRIKRESIEWEEFLHLGEDNAPKPMFKKKQPAQKSYQQVVPPSSCAENPVISKQTLSDQINEAKKLAARFSRNPNEEQGNTSIVIENLPVDYDILKIGEQFGSFGKMIECKVVGSGKAIINYQFSESATEAVSTKNQTIIPGSYSKISVTFSTENTPGAEIKIATSIPPPQKIIAGVPAVSSNSSPVQPPKPVNRWDKRDDSVDRRDDSKDDRRDDYKDDRRRDDYRDDKRRDDYRNDRRRDDRRRDDYRDDRRRDDRRRDDYRDDRRRDGYRDDRFPNDPMNMFPMNSDGRRNFSKNTFEPSNEVYIAQLPPGFKQEVLEDFVKSFGVVNEIKMLYGDDARVIVRYSSLEEARMATGFDRRPFPGYPKSRLVVQYAKPKKFHPNNLTLNDSPGFSPGPMMNGPMMNYPPGPMNGPNPGPMNAPPGFPGGPMMNGPMMNYPPGSMNGPNPGPMNAPPAPMNGPNGGPQFDPNLGRQPAVAAPNFPPRPMNAPPGPMNAPNPGPQFDPNLGRQPATAANFPPPPIVPSGARSYNPNILDSIVAEGVPRNWNDLQTRQFFEGYGELLEAGIAQEGIALIKFKFPHSAEAVQSHLDGTIIGGSSVTLKVIRTGFGSYEDKKQELNRRSNPPPSVNTAPPNNFSGNQIQNQPIFNPNTPNNLRPTNYPPNPNSGSFNNNHAPQNYPVTNATTVPQTSSFDQNTNRGNFSAVQQPNFNQQNNFSPANQTQNPHIQNPHVQNPHVQNPHVQNLHVQNNAIPNQTVHYNNTQSSGQNPEPARSQIAPRTYSRDPQVSASKSDSAKFVISNLPDNSDEGSLNALCSFYGVAKSINIIRSTFGLVAYVDMEQQIQAWNAVSGLNDYKYGPNNLKVTLAEN